MLANLLTLLLSLGVPARWPAWSVSSAPATPALQTQTALGTRTEPSPVKRPRYVGAGPVLRSGCSDLTFTNQDLTLPCDPKYGDEFCYTMITVEPANRTAANNGKVIFLL